MDDENIAPTDTDSTPTEAEDAELSASDLEDVVGGRGSTSVWIPGSNNQGSSNQPDDPNDPSANLPYAPSG